LADEVATIAVEDAALLAPLGLSAKPSSGRKLLLLAAGAAAAAACRRKAYPICCDEESVGSAEALREALTDVTGTLASAAEPTEGKPFIASSYVFC
jgi:hypothetical protein